MAKYTERVHLLVPLSLILVVCFVVDAQCGRIEDIGNRKINLPYGLCARSQQFGKCTHNCWCCLVGISPIKNLCYDTPKHCDEACRKHSSPTLAATTPTSFVMTPN
ncbi:hypothetical protein VPH35_109101 [Triticum aestivum]